MIKPVVEISLFGACIVRSAEKDVFELTGAKHKALIVLLATAPFGRRTRDFLRKALWQLARHDSGSQNLRKAISDIKRQLGEYFDDLIVTNNTDVTLDLTKVKFIGRPGCGEFLEGLKLPEKVFQDWLNGMRKNPEQIYSLYSNTRQAPAAASVPLIAILPFQLVFGCKKYAMLGDWLAQEVCRSLSRSNLLSVISHLSSREYVKNIIEIESVRARLNVDYCVSGSLREIDGKIVIDADFIDATTGRILWTRQFDGLANEYMDRYSVGIAEVVRAIGGSIADDAISYAKSRSLAELEDHRILVAGVSLMHQPTLKAFAKSRDLIEEAVRRTPAAAEVHAWRGNWYVLSVFNGWSTNPQADTKMAVDSTARALDLDPENAFCLTMDGFVHNNLLQQLDIAKTRYDSALQNNPNESLSWLMKGALHAFRDESDAAIAAANKAVQLSPIDPFGYFYDTLNATAHLSGGEYQRALDFANKSIEKNNRHLSTLRVKISALHHLGKSEEAKKTASDLMRRQPDFTVAKYLKKHPAADSKTGKELAMALKASGIK